MGDAGNSLASHVWKGAHASPKEVKGLLRRWPFFFSLLSRLLSAHTSRIPVVPQSMRSFDCRFSSWMSCSSCRMKCSRIFRREIPFWRIHVPLSLPYCFPVPVSRFQCPCPHSHRHGGQEGCHPRQDRKGGRSVATRAKRVYLSPYVPFNWFDRPPSHMRLLGIQWLSNLLHPDRYPLDIVKETREFYRLFFNRDISDRRAKKILHR